MTEGTTMPADAITVTQADRDLVYSLFWFGAKTELEKRALEYIRDGKGDDARAVQEVARHRTTSLAAQDVPMDAYMRTCRALHWRNAQLRYYGIGPYPLWDEAPHDPPEDFDFSKDGRKPRPLAAQDGLVEALAVHLYERSMSKTLGAAKLVSWSDDTKAFWIERARAALASIEVKSS